MNAVWLIIIIIIITFSKIEKCTYFIYLNEFIKTDY